ncbi:hypothetical protein [uncultured Hyphomicrobium sp.]|uniref:hypothetical protein n=1 Tax=uncultured Hyphomicrobium sp. TaxID=194373 RepID=UPI0025D0D7E1|nr:hypothetical protein [uncultured Hyphomicrobium sp.]
MNERVKAILHTALRLSPEEREELARTLMDTLGADPAETDQLLAASDASSGAADEAPQQPASDVLAKYLDI